MGRGIMEVTAAAGLKVAGIKLTGGDLSAPKGQIQKSLDRRVKKGKLTRGYRNLVLKQLGLEKDSI